MTMTLLGYGVPRAYVTRAALCDLMLINLPNLKVRRPRSSPHYKENIQDQ